MEAQEQDGDVRDDVVLAVEEALEQVYDDELLLQVLELVPAYG